MIGDADGSLEPQVEFNASDGIWLQLGPCVVSNDGVFEDETTVKFRIAFRSMADDDYESEPNWETYPHEFPAHTPISKFHRISMPPGSYKFTAQYVDILNGIVSLPSQPSAVLTVLDTDE